MSGQKRSKKDEIVLKEDEELIIKLRQEMMEAAEVC
jgi:hypothetical protein